MRPQIVCLEEGALFDRATLCIAEAECGNDASKTALVARYRALSRFHLQQYFDNEGASGVLGSLCSAGLVAGCRCRWTEALSPLQL